MCNVLRTWLSLIRTWLGTRAQLQLEILALRHQVTVLRRQRKARAPPTSFDRAIWVWLYRLWPGCLNTLVIVKPETVVRWHREGFRRYWRWKSCARRPGRPAVPPDIRKLIARMGHQNPLWGAPRIHGELLKLGIEISQATVSKYLTRRPRPPSQTWQAFLKNHVGCLASIDFFTVPTMTFGVLFVFIVLRHERRRIVHFGITAHPTAPWVTQQLREAFPWDSAPRHVIRDRDSAYGTAFRATVEAMGIEAVVTAPRSPWQNPYVERVIGSIRRECLNHVIVFNEGHLKRILSCYLDYYHASRTHLALGKDAPNGRPAQFAQFGKVVAIPWPAMEKVVHVD